MWFLCRICYTDTSSPQEDQYPPQHRRESEPQLLLRAGKPAGLGGPTSGGLVQVLLLMSADKKLEYRSY